jgi:hypothetical protein
MVDIYMPVVECGYVPFFAGVLSVYSYMVYGVRKLKYLADTPSEFRTPLLHF